MFKNISIILILILFPAIVSAQKDTPAKKKARIAYMKYVNASQKIVKISENHYQKTLKWLSKWKKSAVKNYRTEIQKKIIEFEKFPKNISKLQAPMSEIREIRTNDVQMLNCIVEIYIEYKKQITMGWEPMENAAIRKLMKKYDEHSARYKVLHRAFVKKYGSTSK